MPSPEASLSGPSQILNLNPEHATMGENMNWDGIWGDRDHEKCGKPRNTGLRLRIGAGTAAEIFHKSTIAISTKKCRISPLKDMILASGEEFPTGSTITAPRRGARDPEIKSHALFPAENTASDITKA